MATVPFNKVRGRMMADPEFRKEYDALGEKFALIEAMVEARTQANMTQADVAKAMGVSQPRVARIESGKNVSLETLRRYAEATGGKLKISIEPGNAKGNLREAR